jgi:hypothetical protein
MNRSQQIQTVLNNFNFEQVRSLMSQRPDQWWRGASGETPTIDELVRFARELLEQAAQPTTLGFGAVSSGGFHAYRWPWEGNDGTDCNMQLIFAVEEFDA